jgi:virginiamycin B lyase
LHRSAIVMALLLATTAASGQADSWGRAALSGTVRCAKDGALEGVIVIAKRQKDAILIAVSTNAAGHYEFPPDRLPPGSYALSIRATGYALPPSRHDKPVTISADIAAERNLTIVPVSDPSTLASQLTNLEWLNSFPDSEQKDVMVRNITNCGFCHSLERIARSTHTAEEFRAVIRRMASYDSDHSSGDRIQVSQPQEAGDGAHWWGRDFRTVADYFATVNLSGGKSGWTYRLRTLPRPAGKATRAIVTVFPIPRPQSIVHDLDVDSGGNVWYGNTSWDYIGRLNSLTGEFSEWAAPNFLPPAAPNLDRILGVMDIQVDPDDDVWAAVGGTTIARFSPKSGTWKTWDVPVLWLNPFRSPVHEGQHSIWVAGIVAPPTEGKWHETAFKLDVHTDTISRGIPLFDDKPEPIDPGHDHPFRYCYMMDQDAAGNFICTNPIGSSLVRADLASGQSRLIATPTPFAYPRRGFRDPQNRFWFSEFFADKIGVLDLATDKITEYPVGAKYISPYYARPDKKGRIWVSSNGSDRLLRLDPANGQVTEYLMPVYYDARKIVVDLTAAKTTVWLANKNAGQLIRVEVPD